MVAEPTPSHLAVRQVRSAARNLPFIQVSWLAFVAPLVAPAVDLTVSPTGSTRSCAPTADLARERRLVLKSVLRGDDTLFFVGRLR